MSRAPICPPPARTRRPRAVLGAALAVTLSAGCSGPERTPLTIGVARDAPGLSVSVTGEDVGLATAVGRVLARDLGHAGRDEIGWTTSTGRTRAADVATGRVDLALGPDPVPPGRADELSVVGPYLVDGLRLAVQRADAASSPAALTGRSVCVAAGSGAHRRVEQVVPGAAVTTRLTISTCLTDLAAGRVDAALDEGVVLAGYLASPAYRAVRVLPQRLTTDEHVVLVPKGRPDLCRTVTRSLRDMVASGAWDRAVDGDLVTTGILDRRPPRPVVRGCD